MKPSPIHTPVLLEESLIALNIKPDGIYVDGTFGRGGHSLAILQKLGPQGSLIAFDKDNEAVRHAQEFFVQDKRFTIIAGSFAMLKESIAKLGYLGKINGFLLDLGVSSPQLDTAERGFSFQHDGVLDMRMDRTSGLTAEAWIRTVSEEEMVNAFKLYGEERYARRIAGAIVSARQDSAITTTKQLADIVAKAHPAWEKHKHPATRVFQAIRIVINRELEDLKIVLSQVLDVLAVGGRLVVISFHSLEDRIVKQFMQKNSQIDCGPEDLPIATKHLTAKLQRIGKMITPNQQESHNNPRARSARMRIAEKLA